MLYDRHGEGRWERPAPRPSASPPRRPAPGAQPSSASSSPSRFRTPNAAHGYVPVLFHAPRHVMRPWAGFHADHAARQVAHEHAQLRAGDAALERDGPALVEPDDMKHVLPQVNAER